MQIGDIQRNKGELSALMGVSLNAFSQMLELGKDKKITQPEKKFKDDLTRVDKLKKYAFTFIVLGNNKSFLFMGTHFPFDRELTTLIKKAEKERKKTSLNEALIAYCKLIEKIKIRGYAQGFCKYESQDDAAKTVSFEINDQGLVYDGVVSKKNLLTLIKEIPYELTTKTDMRVLFGREDNEPKKIKKRVEPLSTIDTDNGQLEPTKQKLKKLVELLKQIPANNFLKKIELIAEMKQTIEEVGDIPPKFLQIMRQLEGQRAKMIPKFDQQIDGLITKNKMVYDEVDWLATANELQEIFNTSLMLHKGWKKYIPEQQHQNHDLMDAYESEIDLVQLYLSKLRPLRAAYDRIVDETEEKALLRSQINGLIDQFYAEVEQVY